MEVYGKTFTGLGPTALDISVSLSRHTFAKALFFIFIEGALIFSADPCQEPVKVGKIF